MEVKLVIDGKETTLVSNGESDNYQKFKEPGRPPAKGKKKQADEEELQPLIANVYVLKGGLERTMERVRDK